MAAPPDDLEDEYEASPVNAGLASVSPNSVSDQPARVDTLGFKPYVEAVAVFLTHTETRPPLTLSVEGAWGSGKSSFMLQLEDCIRAKGGKSVWFNAWRHDKEDELWAAFALDFTNKLAATVPPWKRWLLHLKLSYLRFDWQRGWFQVAKFVTLAVLFVYISVAVARFMAAADSPFHQFFSPATQQTSDKGEPKIPRLEEILLTSLLKVGGLAGYLLLGFALVRKISEVIGNPLKIELTRYIQDPKYEARANFAETFHSDFDRLVRTYAEGCRVFVFVDDLDRCEVPKAAELMQALNLLISESAPVFYILGLDRAKIAAGLAAKYEKLLPYLSANSSGKASAGAVGTEFGYTYLEKFIQLPFLVPQPAEKDIDKLLDSLGPRAESTPKDSPPPPEVDHGLLVSLFTDSPSVREVVRMVAPSFDYNPRRLKQFVNLFRLRALLASQTGLFGGPRDARFAPLTFEQLGKLVAILLRWPLLIADLASRPDLLTKLQEGAWKTLSGSFYRGLPVIMSELEEFWTAKRSLMELISFPLIHGKFSAKKTEEPSLNNEEQAKFGLHRVDIERFLQVSPMVRGREGAEVRATEADDDRNESARPFEPAANSIPQQEFDSVFPSGDDAVHRTPSTSKAGEVKLDPDEEYAGSSYYPTPQGVPPSESPMPPSRQPVSRSARRKMKK